MKTPEIRRRDLLLATAAMALAGGFASAGRAAPKARYDPAARFKLKVSEVEFRRTPKGTPLLARIYQPIGDGPWPVVMDLHGGGWAEKDRQAEELFDRKMAVAGALVVAIDYTLSDEAPYPACIQDANYAIRWLKHNAAKWNGDASKIGLFGSSSGGHIAQLLMLRPHDPRYGALPFAENPKLDAVVDYVIGRSPGSDPYAMYQTVVELKNTGMVDKMKTFFTPFANIHDANPREILERREKVTLKPLLVMQGELDDNVPTAVQNRFVKAFRAMGGQCDYEIFKDCDHQWVGVPGPQTDRAHQMARAFIARQVNM
ncbi:alpha/beta hydrolase [Sphingomonas sp. MG17]|uniref:Alpha/beta hydrolase n=1 Tax=Sphingomonas tagetis TaxID=2949092 RepID=A0A9X2HI15_9SPHN|nr:alpha/beta hydrolase [Sphingomonas tagetis]MCP3729982.1 alpha/beta hydrolase [Sphingomonas tagetis]